MNLTDTGPLVALLDRDDQHYASCMAATDGLGPGPMVTTWPCFTEAMHLLGKHGGHRYQSALWRLYFARHVVIHELSQPEIDRAAGLMEKYSNVPMDLADASLVAVAESHAVRRVFTTDGDFRIYRLADGSAFEPIPAR
ncbi:type II toxin-antitoxin system VapC family toxin [Longimicrobium sp.]|uniref:type II toxin-antitoxin system VapC family toxin n=1 Tax=Longimicrobium sp. TaxID=2029185 RepID=UPI002E31D33C|nr:PIN domain-containing protein [Longimicrobium sp.]HEX6036888.1 PIN domain-containing protein [Longimicrobium sp.]